MNMLKISWIFSRRLFDWHILKGKSFFVKAMYMNNFLDILIKKMCYWPLMIFLIVSLIWMSLGFVKINHLLTRYSLEIYKNNHPIKHPMNHGWQSRTRNIFSEKIRKTLDCLRYLPLITVFPTQNECDKLISNIFFRMLITYAAVAVIFLDLVFLFLDGDVISAAVGTVLPLLTVYGIAGSFVSSRTDVQSKEVLQERQINEIKGKVNFKIGLSDSQKGVFGLLVIFNNFEEKEKILGLLNLEKAKLKVVNDEIPFNVNNSWDSTTESFMEASYCIGDYCCKFQLNAKDTEKWVDYYNQIQDSKNKKKYKAEDRIAEIFIQFKYEREREFDIMVTCDM